MIYQQHVFICCNQREGERRCCNNHHATDICQYAKDYVKSLPAIAGNVRINRAGCLGRCALGPTMVVYPQGVWFTYNNTDDIKRIVDNYLVKGEIVKDLQIPALK